MLPRPWVRTQFGWFGSVVVAATLASLWASCSAPESFHVGTGLVTGAGGAAGTSSPTGGAGSAPNGAAGDSGAAGTSVGAAGDGAALAGTGGGAAGTGAAGTGAAGTGAAGTGAAGTGSAGTTGVAGSDGSSAAGTGGPIALPAIVSDHFVMTGGMGDAAIAGAVTASTDATACAGEPAAANVGACYSITYQPQPLKPGAPSTWAGFFWQYPANNWGAMQPRLIAAGAKSITFYAKGNAGGEKLTFKAGGIVNTPSVATPFSDSFTIMNTITLTKNWTKYTLPMTGVTYGSGVLGAFAWVAEVPNTNLMRFFIHGIVWE
jgi:hypothetical protein